MPNLLFPPAKMGLTFSKLLKRYHVRVCMKRCHVHHTYKHMCYLYMQVSLKYIFFLSSLLYRTMFSHENPTKTSRENQKEYGSHSIFHPSGTTNSSSSSASHQQAVLKLTWKRRDSSWFCAWFLQSPCEQLAWCILQSGAGDRGTWASPAGTGVCGNWNTRGITA